MNHLPFRPKVMSMRDSGYKNHCVPIIAPRPIEAIDPDVALEHLDYIIQTQTQAHNNLLEGLVRQQNGDSSVSLGRAVQQARQQLNQAVSVRKKELAQIYGLSVDQFTHRYLPRSINGCWFCTEHGKAQWRSPVDALREKRQELLEMSTIESHLF